jgi:hypothetical protein
MKTPRSLRVSRAANSADVFQGVAHSAAALAHGSVANTFISDAESVVTTTSEAAQVEVDKVFALAEFARVDQLEAELRGLRERRLESAEELKARMFASIESTIATPPERGLDLAPSVHAFVYVAFAGCDVIGIWGVLTPSGDPLTDMVSNGTRGIAASMPILGLAVAVTIAVLVLAELSGTALARLACASKKSRLITSVVSAVAGVLLLVGLGSALGLARATWMESFAATQEEGLLTVSVWQLVLIQIVVFLGAAAASFMVWDEVASQERALTARLAGQIGSLTSAYSSLAQPGPEKAKGSQRSWWRSAPKDTSSARTAFAEPLASNESDLEQRAASLRTDATSAAKASSMHAVLRHLERFEFDSRVEAAAHLADAERHHGIARHLLRGGRRGVDAGAAGANADASLPESPRDVVDEARKRHDEMIDELTRQVDEVLAHVVRDLLEVLSEQSQDQEP